MLQNIRLFILCVNTLCFERNKGTFKRPITQYYFLKFTYWLYINWQTIGESTWLSTTTKITTTTKTTTTPTTTHRSFCCSSSEIFKRGKLREQHTPLRKTSFYSVAEKKTRCSTLMDSFLVIVILICVCISVGIIAICTAGFMLFCCSVPNISLLFVEISGHKNIFHNWWFWTWHFYVECYVILNVH